MLDCSLLEFRQYLIGVAVGGTVFVTNGETGFELPIWRVNDPPLLPGRVTSEPFKKRHYSSGICNHLIE